MSTRFALPSPDVADALSALDSALPRIAESFDLPAVARLFERAWRRPIIRCTLLSTRYEPGARCVTTYELEAADFPRTPARTIGVVEVTPAGRSHRRYDEDPLLPGLAAAVDPAVIGQRLASSCAVPVDGCTVAPVRYRPGERAVLRYLLTTSAGRVVLYGKVVAEGVRALSARLAGLHDAERNDPGAPSVLPPIAVLDDLGLLVQAEVAGDSLHALAFTSALPAAERVALLRRVGRAIAALHEGAGPSAPARTAADDVRELRSYLPAAGIADPPLAARLVDAVERAGLAILDVPGQALVPSHGALRTDQVYVSAERVTLIDLDGYCWSQRARDIGNFLAYLRWKAIRQPAHRALVAEGRRAFRAAYRRTGEIPSDDVIRIAEAMSLLKVAGRRFRNLSVREWPSVPALVDVALELLPKGKGAR
jgi:hypothetical protein